MSLSFTILLLENLSVMILRRVPIGSLRISITVASKLFWSLWCSSRKGSKAILSPPDCLVSCRIRRSRSSRWLTSCPIAERSFWAGAVAGRLLRISTSSSWSRTELRLFAVSIKDSITSKADSRVRRNRLVVELSWRSNIDRQYFALSSLSRSPPVSSSTSSHIVVVKIMLWKAFLPQSFSNIRRFFKGVPTILLSDIRWK